jgi:VanZ family protein
LVIATPIWRKPHFLYYWLPPLMWGVAVVCMSGDLGSAKHTRHLLEWLLSGWVSLNPEQYKIINRYLRKIGHLMAYGSMYFLWFRALRGHGGYGPWRAFFQSMVLCLTIAGLDEGRQWLHRSRGGSLLDVGWDMIGSGLGALITAWGWRPRLPGKLWAEPGG